MSYLTWWYILIFTSHILTKMLRRWCIRVPSQMVSINGLMQFVVVVVVVVVNVDRGVRRLVRRVKDVGDIWGRFPPTKHWKSFEAMNAALFIILCQEDLCSDLEHFRHFVACFSATLDVVLCSPFLCYLFSLELKKKRCSEIFLDLWTFPGCKQ